MGTLASQLSDTQHAAVNIAASCEGILTTHLKPSSSEWYPSLSKQLKALQRVAEKWEKQESNYFEQKVIPAIMACGQNFCQSQTDINQCFDNTSAEFAVVQPQLLLLFTQLQTAVNMAQAVICDYEKSLKTWGDELRTLHDALSQTVGEIQAKAFELDSDIQSINATIQALINQVTADKALIAKAKKAEKKDNVIKTIFGVLVGVATEGVGGILVGMGVASIVGAESKVKALESSIQKYQKQIQESLQTISEDKQELVALQMLTLPTKVALSDVAVAELSLSDLRTSWELLHQEMIDVIHKIQQAQSSDVLVVQQAWFNAACKEWAQEICPQ